MDNKNIPEYNVVDPYFLRKGFPNYGSVPKPNLQNRNSCFIKEPNGWSQSLSGGDKHRENLHVSSCDIEEYTIDKLKVIHARLAFGALKCVA